jgi:hypothetical protein
MHTGLFIRAVIGIPRMTCKLKPEHIALVRRRQLWSIAYSLGKPTVFRRKGLIIAHLTLRSFFRDGDVPPSIHEAGARQSCTRSR